MSIKLISERKALPGIYFVLFLLVLVSFYLVDTYQVTNISKSEIVDQFQENTLDQLDILEANIERIKSVLSKNQDRYWPEIEEIVNEDEVLAQIYLNDQLFFWNNSEISNDILFIQFDESKVFYSSGGWYLVCSEKLNSFTIFLFKKIKTQFPYQNSFLSNSLSNDFSTSQNIDLELSQETADYQIVDRNGKFLIGLVFDDELTLNNATLFLLFFLYLLVLLTFVLLIDSFYDSFKVIFKYDFLAFLFLIIVVVLIRIAVAIFLFPEAAEDSFLFRPNIKIGFFVTSIGDLIITFSLLLVLSIRLYGILIVSKVKSYYLVKYIYSLGFGVLMWLMTFLFFFVIHYSIINLPFNSFIGFNIKAAESIFTLFYVLLSIICLFFLSRGLGRYLINSNIQIVFHFFIQFLVTFLAYFIIDNYSVLIWLTVAFTSVSLFIIYLNPLEGRVSLIKYIFLLVLFSSIIAIVINQAIREKNDNHQLETIELLNTNSSPKLEQLYQKYIEEISKDEYFREIVKAHQRDLENRITDYISEKYFKELLFKYHIQVTICEEEKLIDIQPENIVVECIDYFNEMIDYGGREVSRYGLYLMNSEPESIYYIGRQYLPGYHEELEILMFTEFFHSFTPTGLGFPELLVDNSTFKLDLSGYSYARYNNNELTYKKGDFPYQTSYQYLEKYADNEFFIIGNYRHFKTRISNDNYLIVSRPVEKLSVQIVFFSSLFIVLAFTILIVFLVIYGKRVNKLLRESFKTRLQIFFISTISLIIILIATISLYYINLNNKNDLVEQLRERTSSVLVELNHKLAGIGSLQEYDHFELEQLLVKFSKVFFSDINIYNMEGVLVATSRPEIFDMGLISENINPMAYEELLVKNNLYYVTEEHIGTATYYSSYDLMMLGGNEPTGILNLPYFARQSEVVQSYYLMIFTFVNLFVILGIIGALIALALSRVITKPLIVLQQNLAGIQIDQQNEPIRWGSNDEIGQLISEYNRMIQKLEQSTQLLKQSERESTWRQVAQQIAHEIKNPLTPMKLNVQYLEKAFREQDPSLHEKIGKISGSLIAQIDSLNKVAEMFSDFAKTKIGNFVQVNLVKVINDSIQLFENHPMINIEFVVEKPMENYTTTASEKDLLRLFNNLIKNAIQSIGQNKNGKINIKLSLATDYHMVSVSDNGKGISADVKEYIFQPYFTTKSTGTGLGLAIVKNIMTETGGEISFESKEKKGTTFILKFPKS